MNEVYEHETKKKRCTADMRFPAYTTGYRIDRSLLNDTKSEALARKKSKCIE